MLYYIHPTRPRLPLWRVGGTRPLHVMCTSSVVQSTSVANLIGPCRPSSAGGYSNRCTIQSGNYFVMWSTARVPKNR